MVGMMVGITLGMMVGITIIPIFISFCNSDSYKVVGREVGMFLMHIIIGIASSKQGVSFTYLFFAIYTFQAFQ